MSVTFSLQDNQRLCDICRDPKRMAKGKKGIVCNTRSACQKHTVIAAPPLEENEEGSSRGSEPLYESPRFGKRKRSVVVHGRPLSKLFADQILRDIARECDQHAKELRKAFKDEITLRDTRARELIQDTQGEVIKKEREIKDLKRRLRRLRETLGMLSQGCDPTGDENGKVQDDARESPRDSERTHSGIGTGDGDHTALAP
ncbi:g9092 [Coccomyxa viridis]|uniref:G9092 protein n=1 Tax=Coccomyxa viridis TaxID=1274662 RepID=A0ABP1G4M3_9CHLO